MMPADKLKIFTERAARAVFVSKNIATLQHARERHAKTITFTSWDNHGIPMIDDALSRQIVAAGIDAVLAAMEQDLESLLSTVSYNPPNKTAKGVDGHE